MWSSTGNTWKDVDLCRVGIVLNYWTMLYCKSCSGCFSTWICVLYLWIVTSGVFYILASINLPFLCILFCLFEKCVNSIFPILLTGRELTSELFGAQPCLRTKGFMHLFLCASEGLTTWIVSFLLFLRKQRRGKNPAESVCRVLRYPKRFLIFISWAFHLGFSRLDWEAKISLTMWKLWFAGIPRFPFPMLDQRWAWNPEHSTWYLPSLPTGWVTSGQSNLGWQQLSFHKSSWQKHCQDHQDESNHISPPLLCMWQPL